MSKLFVSKRTRAAAWVILLVLPALMAAFGYYHSHRPAVNPVGSRTFWDHLILNSDILLGLFFLLASAILGIPIWADTVVILLIPIVSNLALQTNKSMMN